jgi:glyoxylase-like metal-dependent hydrolase (beta-lactamase superfamily II)
MLDPTLRIGSIDIWPVMDGVFRLPEPPGFPPEGAPGYAPHADSLNGDGTWRMDIGAFVVRSGDRLVLLDAGAGPSDGAVYSPTIATCVEDIDRGVLSYLRSMGRDDDQILAQLQSYACMHIRHGSLGANLAQLGLAPEDFTDIVLSHLHHDHIGWVSKDAKPYFPNATVRCERRDADFFLAPDHDDSFYRWMSNAAPTEERMAPVLDRLELWDADTTVAPGIDCRFAPGHTPGSCLVVLSSGPERALVLGDTVHCPLELTLPEFALMSDMDQALADRTRDMIRRELDDGATVASAPHFSGLRFGRLLPGGGQRGWVFD